MKEIIERFNLKSINIDSNTSIYKVTMKMKSHFIPAALFNAVVKEMGAEYLDFCLKSH